MSDYRVSKTAQGDIRNIGLYTQREWGIEQRRRYLSGLDQKFGELAENPRRSPEHTEFEPPVRIHHHEKHLIVYVQEGAGILIVRVLHESMDVPARLDGR